MEADVALVRWSPFNESADMRREMQSLAGLMTSRFVPFMGEGRFIPAMDVTTRGDDLLIKLEIPAVDIEKDVDISVKRSEDGSEDREGHYMREIYGTFERTLPLPEGVGPDAVKAEYRDGILEVTVTGGAKPAAPPEAQRIRITRGPGSPSGTLVTPD